MLWPKQINILLEFMIHAILLRIFVNISIITIDWNGRNCNTPLPTNTGSSCKLLNGVRILKTPSNPPPKKKSLIFINLSKLKRIITEQKKLSRELPSFKIHLARLKAFTNTIRLISSVTIHSLWQVNTVIWSPGC